MYVAVKGGEKAVRNSRKLVAKKRRGDTRVPEMSTDQIRQQPGLGVDRVMDILIKQGLVSDTPSARCPKTGRDMGEDLTRHPFLGELKAGYAAVCFTPPELGFEISIGRIRLTECVMVSRQDDAYNKAAGFDTGYGLVFGQNERKAMSMPLLDRSLSDSDKKADAGTGKAAYPAQDPEFILSHCDSVESSGFVQHLKLPHYVDFQSELVFIRSCGSDPAPAKGED